MASLTLYGSNVSNGALTTACNMAASGTSGTTEATKTTAPPNGTGRFYCEVWSLGNASLPSGDVFSSLPSPQGNGWVYSTGSTTVASGNWSASVNVNVSPGFGNGSQLTLRFYKYSSGTYTSIGSITANVTTSGKQLYSFAATSMSSVTFGSSDFLYVDLWFYDPNGPGGDNPTVYESSSSSTGITSDVQVNLPNGTIVYGSDVANGTLTTACTMPSTGGPGEQSATTVPPGGTGHDYAEVWSQGNPALPSGDVFASLPSPQGNGWVYQPGSGTFATGNWSGSISVSFAVVDTGNTLTLRFYKYSSGTYTSIGTITANVSVTTRTTYSFAATSMSSVTFGSSDLLYVDLWLFDPTGPGGDNPTVYESTLSTVGVTNDVQVTTSNFTATHRIICDGYGGVFS